MERICRGPFYASPLLVVSHDQGPGLEAKKRVCRNLSKGDSRSNTPAVNEFIDKQDFPTRFDMPWKMAELVSYHFSIPFSPFHFFRRPWPFLHAKASAAVLISYATASSPHLTRRRTSCASASSPSHASASSSSCTTVPSPLLARRRFRFLSSS